MWDKNPNAGELATDLDRLVKTGAEGLAVLAGVGVTAEFLRKGTDLSRLLKELDQEQEAQLRARRRDAAADVRELCGVVLPAVREINDMGRSVHADDRVKARQYSLAVLHRNMPTPAAEAKPPFADPSISEGAEKATGGKPAAEPGLPRRLVRHRLSSTPRPLMDGGGGSLSND